MPISAHEAVSTLVNNAGSNEPLRSEAACIAVFTSLFPPAFRGGGPIRSTEALVASSPEGLTPVVLAGDRDLGEVDTLPVERNCWVRYGDVPVYYASLKSPRKLFAAFAAVKKKKPAILHFNSFFAPHLTIIPLMLWRLGYWGRPLLLLSPRGEFGDGALRRRAWKKRLYIAVFRFLGIHRSIIWHSTAEHETSAIHAHWGAGARVIFRGENTLLPTTASRPASARSGPLRTVFIGRIVEHKGVMIAVKALQSCRAPLTLDVFGTREDAGYALECENAARELPANVSVSFHDAVRPENVRGVLAEYDVLVLPTAGENFGHVIAEALSVSCVVVTTPYTPWTDLLRDGAGVVVGDRSVESWRQAMESLAQLTPNEIFARRMAAGESFEVWATTPRPPHLWELTRA